VANFGIGTLVPIFAAVTLRDGRRIEAHVRDCRGSAGRPMTDSEIGRKFLDQGVMSQFEIPLRKNATAPATTMAPIIHISASVACPDG
jgi:hypothetical protein